MHPALQRFCVFYENFNTESLGKLPEIYSADIAFRDPAHQMKGLEALQMYFSRMLKKTHSCRFEVETTMESEGNAWVSWKMHFQHPRLNGGREISVPGVSHLKFNNQVHYHRDYFDLGAMLYEYLPLLGRILRSLKRRLAS